MDILIAVLALMPAPSIRSGWIDTDADTNKDSWEDIANSTTHSLAALDGMSLDVDGDGAYNSEELAYGSDPFDMDSDDDGLNDGDEIHLANELAMKGYSLLDWMADQIPIDRIKLMQGLPLDTRMLIAKLANFQLTKAEAVVLAAKPGAADAIIELSEIVEEFEHLSDVFGVLRMRSDLTDTQQRRIHKMLNPLVGNMENGRSSVVKQQGLHLIGQYTGEENEALLIRFLGERTHWRDSDFSDVAAEGLARMGTPKALEALRQYAVRSKPPEGYQSRGYDAAVKAEKQIPARSSDDTINRPPTSSTINRTTSKTAKPESDQATIPSEEPASSTPWGVIVVLMVSAAGLLWLLFKATMGSRGGRP